MREGGKILAKILDEVTKTVKPGIETKELDELATELIFSYGGKPAFLGYGGFPAALCVSVNEVIVHGVPSEINLQEGDIVGLDLGILYPFKNCVGCFAAGGCAKTPVEGFYTDMAVTVPVGKIDPEVEKIMKVAKRSLELAIEQVRPGNHLGDIGFAIQQYVEKQGFSVIRDLVGHGVGKELHEDPQIPNFGKRGLGPELKPGMTLAIEPMISAGGHELVKSQDGYGYETKDKSRTAHFEHTAVVTGRGCEVLTKI